MADFRFNMKSLHHFWTWVSYQGKLRFHSPAWPAEKPPASVSSLGWLKQDREGRGGEGKKKKKKKTEQKTLWVSAKVAVINIEAYKNSLLEKPMKLMYIRTVLGKIYAFFGRWDYSVCHKTT